MRGVVLFLYYIASSEIIRPIGKFAAVLVAIRQRGQSVRLAMECVPMDPHGHGCGLNGTTKIKVNVIEIL